LKIIDLKSNKETKVEVIIDVGNYIDISGMIFKIKDKKKLDDFPFIIDNQFYIGFTNIKKCGLKTQKGEEQNLLQLNLYYEKDNEERNFQLEFDFGSILFIKKFNNNELKEKFIDKILINNFQSTYRGILEEIHRTIDEHIRYTKFKREDEKWIAEMEARMLKISIDIEKYKEKEGIKKLVEEFKKNISDEKFKILTDTEATIDKSIPERKVIEMKMMENEVKAKILYENMEKKYNNVQGLDNFIKKDDEGKKLRDLENYREK